MADYYPIVDADETIKTIRATDNAGIHSPHNVMETLVSGVPTPVSNTHSLPVAVASLPLPSGAATEATLAAASAKLPASLGAKTGANSLSVVPNSDTAFPVTAPTITKGTQGANGFTTQDIKDAGRNLLTFWAVAVAAGTTGTETAISLQRTVDDAAGGVAASFAITNNKRFRITSLMFMARGHSTATAQVTTFSLRVNTAGAVTTSSTPVMIRARCATEAVANQVDRFVVNIPDGLEILGDGTLEFGITANAVYTTNAPTWDVFVAGFQY